MVICISVVKGDANDANIEFILAKSFRLKTDQQNNFKIPLINCKCCKNVFSFFNEMYVD